MEAEEAGSPGRSRGERGSGARPGPRALPEAHEAPGKGLLVRSHAPQCCLDLTERGVECLGRRNGGGGLHRRFRNHILGNLYQIPKSALRPRHKAERKRRLGFLGPPPASGWLALPGAGRGNPGRWVEGAVETRGPYAQARGRKPPVCVGWCEGLGWAGGRAGGRRAGMPELSLSAHQEEDPGMRCNQI